MRTWSFEQMDVKDAFLYDDHEEKLFMKQLVGFAELGKEMVW